MKINRRFVLALAIALGVLGAAGLATTALASPASGTITTVLGHRATLSDTVQVNNERIKFQTKGPTDALVQTITFRPHSFTGWHFHPGIVIVVVESGQVTTHNASCETKTYGPHETFVESGSEPFEVSNESDTTDAVVYATLIVPAGDAFRIETDPPACA